jgi:hypothetical protein
MDPIGRGAQQGKDLGKGMRTGRKGWCKYHTQAIACHALHIEVEEGHFIIHQTLNDPFSEAGFPSD